MADLPLGFQPLEARNRFGKRDIAAPVQEIQIKHIGFQPFQAALGSGNHAFGRCIIRIDFADQEYLGPSAGDDFTNQLFSFALAIHFGGVDKRHAKINT